MPVFILLALGGLGWAWWTGKLKGYTYEDGIAAAIFLLGTQFMFKGRVLPGALMMAGAILWAAWRRAKAAQAIAKAVPVNEARLLLGVPEDASLADIRAAHRRLITKVHPDAGGSAELANRVNAARDALVAEMNRKPPRAS
ncbi:MAG TPA: DnaJ domain-containing protein [Allosphingosinicella sp.]|jgi:hypothetical protein